MLKNVNKNKHEVKVLEWFSIYLYILIFSYVKKWVSNILIRSFEWIFLTENNADELLHFYIFFVYALKMKGINIKPSTNTKHRHLKYLLLQTIAKIFHPAYDCNYLETGQNNVNDFKRKTCQAHSVVRFFYSSAILQGKYLYKMIT